MYQTLPERLVGRMTFFYLTCILVFFSFFLSFFIFTMGLGPKKLGLQRDTHMTHRLGKKCKLTANRQPVREHYPPGEPTLQVILVGNVSNAT